MWLLSHQNIERSKFNCIKRSINSKDAEKNSHFAYVRTDHLTLSTSINFSGSHSSLVATILSRPETAQDIRGPGKSQESRNITHFFFLRTRLERHPNTESCRAYDISVFLFQLSNPLSVKPPLRFGTIPYTYTEDALRKHFPLMHEHMRQHNVQSVWDGISKIKWG